MKRFFRWVLLGTIAFGISQHSLRAQEPEPTAVIPPPSAALNSSSTKIVEKPVAYTPLQGAHELYLMGQFDRAIERYRASLQGGAVDAAAYAGIARAYLKLKQPDEAFAAASKAVELDPFLPASHTALGDVYIRQGKLYEAQSEFLQPFKDHHSDPRAYYGLHRLYIASFNFKKAKVAIDQAYALDPKDPEISGAWMASRPLAERIKAAEDTLGSPTGFYNRSQMSDLRHNLAVMKDEAAHPERTCKLVSRPETADIPLVPSGTEDHRTGLVAIETKVNGAKARLVVGTFRDMLTINNKVAEKANLEQIVRTNIDGLGEDNPPEGYVAFAQSVSVGNLQLENCYVRVVQEAAEKSFYSMNDGVFPVSLLPGYLVDIDFPYATLRLRPLPARPSKEDVDAAQMDSKDPDAAKFSDRYVSPDMSSWTQLYQLGGAIVIPARVNDSPPKLFSVTSEAYSNALSSNFAEEWASAPKDPSALTVDSRSAISPNVYSTDGRITARWSGPIKLEFAGFYFGATAERSFSLKMMSDRGAEIGGIIGLETLKNLRVMIDYRDGLIHFDNSWNRQ